MNHYPRHIGDWMVATAHLTEVEECMYSRLIDAYYARELPLPLDVAACCRLVRAAASTARKAVSTVLHEFFVEQADGWHQKRCDEELAKYREKSAKASESASVRWSERNANAMRTHSEGNANQNQEPEPRTRSNTSLRSVLQAPSEEHRSIAQSLGLNCDEQFQRYRDHFSATGKPHKDQNAGFRNWLKRANEFSPRVAPARTDARAATTAAIWGEANGKRPDTIDGTAERVG